jgi:hypothetical protein
MSTVISVFPGLSGNTWLLSSGGAPIAPLYVELVVPPLFWAIVLALVVAGATVFLVRAVPRFPPSHIAEVLRTVLHWPPRHRHRHV